MTDQDHAKIVREAGDTMRLRVVQEGMTVASVDGPSLYAMRQAGHYLAIYSQDGPCKLQFYTKGRRWRDVREGELENAIEFRAKQEPTP